MLQFHEREFLQPRRAFLTSAFVRNINPVSHSRCGLMTKLDSSNSVKHLNDDAVFIISMNKLDKKPGYNKRLRRDSRDSCKKAHLWRQRIEEDNIKHGEIVSLPSRKPDFQMPT